VSDLAVDLDVPADTVRRAAAETLSVRPAGEDDALEAEVSFQTGDPVPIRLSVTPLSGFRTRAVLQSPTPPPVPYFSWFVGPILRSAARRAVAHAAAALQAGVAGAPAPRPPRRPPLAPPSAFDDRQAVLLATVCAVTAAATFGGSLLSQNVDYVGDTFDADTPSLSSVLALSRAGVLIALLGGALADRRGRRRLLLASFAGVCLANGVAALAPNLVVFTAGQVLMRGFVNTTLTLAAIAAIEEAPEGARAYSLALLGLAGGFGYGFGVMLLPLADLGAETWRISFAVSAASVLLLPGFARRLAETKRYAGLAARGARRGQVSEVFHPIYGGRFGLLVLATFLFAIFSAPTSQFTNKYLADVRGFSGFDITVFRAVTQGLPGLAGIAIGGRLAETKGRRPVAATALFAGTIAEIVFLLYGGPVLWLASAAAITLGAMATPALGAFSGELFPTEIRGTANGMLLVAGVTGSALGLLAAGRLDEAGLGLGSAVALMGIPSLVASVVLIPRLPESAARALDEISPSEV
jgi:AAHS family benzoate transporter-like MFS transporter